MSAALPVLIVAAWLSAITTSDSSPPLPSTPATSAYRREWVNASWRQVTALLTSFRKLTSSTLTLLKRTVVAVRSLSRTVLPLSS